MNVYAIKKNNNVIIASDSLVYNVQSNAYEKENCPIFRPKEAQNTVCCISGTFDDYCRVKSIHDLLKEDETVEVSLRKLTPGHMVDNGYKKIEKSFYDMHSLDKNEDFRSYGFELIATINNDFAVLDSFGTVSMQSEYASGRTQASKEVNDIYLQLTSEDCDPIYRIFKAFEARANHGFTVSFPIFIYSSRTDKIECYDINRMCEYIYREEHKEDLK